MMNNKIPEKPILMAASMVSATLAGNKTQTRRTTGLKKINENPDRYLFHKIEDGFAIFWDSDKGERLPVKLPYGLPGHLLWVREKFCLGSVVCGDSVEGEAAPEYIEQCLGQDDVIPYQWAISEGIGIEDVKWKPSIFMFRKDSRINLEITGIRVEHLHDISGHDVLAEGVDNGKSNPSMGIRWENMQKMAFQELWESINGPGSWAANPWLWIVEFKVINATP